MLTMLGYGLVVLYKFGIQMNTIIGNGFIAAGWMHADTTQYMQTIYFAYGNLGDSNRWTMTTIICGGRSRDKQNLLLLCRFCILERRFIAALAFFSVISTDETKYELRCAFGWHHIYLVSVPLKHILRTNKTKWKHTSIGNY